jgi:outer membrane protein TolC
MRLRYLTLLFLGLSAAGRSARAQDALSLKDAVRLALEKNKGIEASAAGQQAAGSRILAARAGMLPKVSYSESWTRSDNPVFVFSSLLTEHQFGAGNFQIGPLNRPDFLNNFQSSVSADQTLYDAGQTRHAVRAAELSKEMAGENRRLAEMDVIAGTVRAYYDAVLSAQLLDAANQSVRSAEADLQRAQTIRSAGMSTDSDVLSIRVHRAGVEEQRIRRAADLDVARAVLNDLLGLPLDTPHSLTTTLERIASSTASLADSEASALALRPEARETKIALSLAENQVADARSALQPQVILHGAFEADRQRFYDRGGANWTVSLGLRWHLFNGFSDRAHIDESKALLHRSQAEQERTGSGIRLEVRRASAGLSAAEQRIAVAEASVAEAQESLRITQNRYEAGLSNTTELLRTETAVLEVRTRYLAAIHDQRVAAAMVELAAGRLNVDSEVLK